MMNDDAFIKMGLAVIDSEVKAVSDLSTRINADFARACHLIIDCQGRLIVIGMGKSGHIGGKIASTLASTGTPAFFVHPGEASHGDFGMITARDVVLAISNSGETEEIMTLLPLLKRLGIPLITLTGNQKSTLGSAAEVVLDTHVDEEACPLGLAPTSSTTATLAMGDALAIALSSARGFTAEDFAYSHPGGNLGRRLLLHINDIMVTGDAVPKVNANALLKDALVEISQKGIGMTSVIDENDHIIGIYTDGDLRRSLNEEVDIHTTVVSDVMGHNPKTARADMLAEQALQIMQKNKVNQLVIVDDGNKVIGALNMHALLRAGVI